MVKRNYRGILIGAVYFMLPLLAQAQAQSPVVAVTPSFSETVNVVAFHKTGFGQEGIHFTRAHHPLDRFAQNDAHVTPRPLPRLRHMTFVIRLELQARTYEKVTSTDKKRLEEELLFYKDLLEHAHRVSNRYVRVCAHHLGLEYEKLSHVTITPGGPVPRTVAEYQQWATQTDPPPCYRDQLFSEKDAERLTRLHHLKRLSRTDAWRTQDFADKKVVEDEIRRLKHDIDGTPWISNMKMSEIKVLEPNQLWLKKSNNMPDIKHGDALPHIKVVSPYQQE